MPKIAVSERAYTALRRHAFSELAGVGERLGDGSMEIAISGRLHDELLARLFPGEAFSACILRYVPTRRQLRRAG